MVPAASGKKMGSLQIRKGSSKRSKALASVTSLATLKTFRCLECLTVLIGKSTLVRHRLTHVVARLFRCDDCGLRFVRKMHLNRHRISHKEALLYQCNSCTASYASKSGLAKHNILHSDQNRESTSAFVICSQCNFIFASEAVLKRHVAARHSVKLNFECGECQAQFNTNSQLDHHVELHKKLRKTPVRLCNKNWDSRSSGSTKNMVLNIECDICYQSFTSLSSIKIHLKNVHRKFYCIVCCTFVDKKYARKSGRNTNKIVCTECRGKKCKKPELDKVAAKPLNWSLPPNPSVQQLVMELLLKLVDDELLRSGGIFDKPVEQQLEGIVELCGLKVTREKEASIEDWLRENVKQLITLSIGEDAARILLRFKSIEAIILCLLESQHEVYTL